MSERGNGNDNDNGNGCRAVRACVAGPSGFRGEGRAGEGRAGELTLCARPARPASAPR